MNKKLKIKKILAFGALILLLLLFIIFTTKNCRTTKAEEITPNYSTISLYDNNNNLIASKPLEPLINIYNGTYEELGKTLLIENELLNSNEKYTFVIDFNYVGNTRYYTSNFKWICNYKTIAVDYELKITSLNSGGNETTKTYIPYEYFSEKSFLIIPNRIFSGSAELSEPVISLSYSLTPSSNIFYSFIDNTYLGYGEGYARGYNEGYDDGIQYNNNESYMQGYNFGKEDGYNLGQMDGYNEGYADGYNEGYDTIFSETVGLTVNFNQLLNSLAYWSNLNGVAILNVNTNKWTITGTSTDSAIRNLETFNIPTGHKVLIRYDGTIPSGFFIQFNSYNALRNDNNWYIGTITDNSLVLRFYLNGTTTNANNTFTLNVFDLTEIYGVGNEPENYDDFRADFPSLNYPYTTDELINTNYEVGYNDGYEHGEYIGIIQGQTHQIEQTNFMVEMFNALDSFLNIRLLPNITIGLLVFIPLMISLTWFIIKAFRGGGGDE